MFRIEDPIKKSLAVLFSVAVYIMALNIVLPSFVGLNARFDYLVPFCFLAVFAFFFGIKKNVGVFLCLSTIFVLFSLPLSSLWTTGLSDGYVIGGLLPFSDPAGYYLDANNLIDGQSFSCFSTRRPLFPGFLSVILWITGGNLKTALAIIVLISAVSVYLAAIEVKKSSGPMAAAFFVLIVFFFYRRYIGKTLTENLGIIFGSLGFAFVWRAAVSEKARDVIFGIFILTLALNARAGAFFILPALIIWGAFFFKGKRFWSYKFFFISIMVVLTGFLVNQILVKSIGSPEGALFSNFSYTLYGLVFGGDWTLAYTNPPHEIIGLGEKAASIKLYQIAIHAIRNDPGLLISGILRAWKVYITQGFAFNFVLAKPIGIVLSDHQAWKVFAIIAILHTLAVTGLYAAYRYGRKGEKWVMVAFFAGVFFSIPFAPPWDSEVGRAYAATVPALCVIPSYGLAYFGRNLYRIVKPGHKIQEMHFDGGYKSGISDFLTPVHIVSYVLVFACFACPIIIKHVGSTPAYSAVNCPDAKESISFRKYSGSYLFFINDRYSKTDLPAIRVEDFQDNMYILRHVLPELASGLSDMKEGKIMLPVQGNAYAIVSAEKIKGSRKNFTMCAEKKQLKYLTLYYVD